jgi:hypothetical protein
VVFQVSPSGALTSFRRLERMTAFHPNSPIGPNGTGSIVCLVLAGSRSLPLRSDPAPKPDSSSHLGLLCQFQGIVDLNAEVPHGALELGVSQQELDCT